MSWKLPFAWNALLSPVPESWSSAWACCKWILKVRIDGHFVAKQLPMGRDWNLIPSGVIEGSVLMLQTLRVFTPLKAGEHTPLGCSALTTREWRKPPQD
eukprot:3981399-Amphidinium_carterae.1